MNKFSKYSAVFLIIFFSFNAFPSAYKRSMFGAWMDVDHNCLDSRQEILKLNSVQPVTIKKVRKCKVVSGEWNDFYYNEKITDPSQIDVDHVVPLKHAYEVGAADWSSDKRHQFANDPENLVVTNKRYNRQKGAKTILEWMPVSKIYACKYVKRWMMVKKKYGLLISAKEYEYFKMLKCE